MEKLDLNSFCVSAPQRPPAYAYLFEPFTFEDHPYVYAIGGLLCIRVKKADGYTGSMQHGTAGGIGLGAVRRIFELADTTINRGARLHAPQAFTSAMIKDYDSAHPEGPLVRIGESVFHKQNVQKIAGLPNVRLELNRDRLCESILTFEGGEGVLMPCLWAFDGA